MRLRSRDEDRVEEVGDTRQGRYAPEAPVGERGAIEPLRRRLPLELAAEPMVVVVAGVGGHGGLGGGEVDELLAVEHLALQVRPEGLDLAVRPGRVDLGPD